MGFVKSIFSRPKPPKITQVVQEAPQAPTVDQAAQQAEQQNRLRRRRGRAAYQRTTPQGLGTPSVATKTLTGQ